MCVHDLFIYYYCLCQPASAYMQVCCGQIGADRMACPMSGICNWIGKTEGRASRHRPMLAPNSDRSVCERIRVIILVVILKQCLCLHPVHTVIEMSSIVDCLPTNTYSWSNRTLVCPGSLIPDVMSTWNAFLISIIDLWRIRFVSCNPASRPATVQVGKRVYRL